MRKYGFVTFLDERQVASLVGDGLAEAFYAGVKEMVEAEFTVGDCGRFETETTSPGFCELEGVGEKDAVVSAHVYEGAYFSK